MSTEHNWVIACGVPVDCGPWRPNHSGEFVKKRAPLDVQVSGGACAIRLKGCKAPGLTALIDEADLHLVAPYSWHSLMMTAATGKIYGPYAGTTYLTDGRVKSALMHKFLTGWPLTDHADHDGLNNQRYNLRPASPSESNANTRKQGRECSSPYKGVTWDSRSRTGSWRAQIGVNGTRHRLGVFSTQEEAARAYDAAAFAAWGEFAYLNFPLADEAADQARGAA